MACYVQFYILSMCYPFYVFTCPKLVENGLLLKSDGCKVMGKCDFKALVVHVYAWSSCRKRRCCCFSCWFLPAQGEKRGGPRGSKLQETSGYLLRACFPPAVMECGKWKSCICSRKFTSWSLNCADQNRQRPRGDTVFNTLLQTRFMDVRSKI